MFISHKSNVIQQIDQDEWQCRRKSKGLNGEEYWTWLASITTQDDDGNDVITYPSEDFTIVECTDEDVQARLTQLGDYQTEGVYNIKWSDKKTKVTVDKVEIETHFTGDDSAKDARILAEEWVNIRTERDRLLAETDWMMLSDTGTVSTAWKNYRKALREIPSSQDSVKVFSDIDWPDKPSS